MNTIHYRECKKFLFIKRCKNRTRQVPRGLNQNELQTMIDGLLNAASIGGLSKYTDEVKNNADQLAESGSILSGKHKEATRISGVSKENLVEAIKALSLGACSLAAQAKSYVSDPRSGCFSHGKFKVKLSWVGDLYEITLLE
jgi:hypothetical protein